jgi:CBS domain-containing protein
MVIQHARFEMNDRAQRFFRRKVPGKIVPMRAVLDLRKQSQNGVFSRHTIASLSRIDLKGTLLAAAGRRTGNGVQFHRKSPEGCASRRCEGNEPYMSRVANTTPVHEFMQRNVETATPNDPVKLIAQRLIDGGLTGLPVIDDTGALVGVVTEYDIISKQGETVGEIMSRGVVTVTEDTSAQRVIDLVGLHGIRGIPVLADGKLVGLVTRADLVTLFLHQA